MAKAWLYRVLASRFLERKLADQGLLSEERKLIEAELRRREPRIRIEVGARRSTPPTAWWRRSLGWLIVYGVPVIGMGTWTYVSCTGFEQSLHGPGASGLFSTLTCFHLPATYAITGELDPFETVVVGVTLAAIPLYALRRSAADGVVSSLAVVWWIFMGNVLLASNV